MKLKKPVDLSDPVPVPALLRTRLIRHLRGAKAIDIREETTRHKYLQCNHLSLTQKSASTMPEEALDDICDVLATAMHARWIEKNEDEETVEPLRFRLEARLHADATRTQSGFNITWDPDNEDAYSEDLEDGMRQDAFSHSQLMLDRQLAYTEELHSVILKLANMNAEPIAASSNLAQWGGQMAMAGMKSQLESHKMNYDREDAQSKHQEETARSADRWERAGKLLQFGVQVVGDKIGERMADNRAASATMRKAAAAAGLDLEPNDDAGPTMASEFAEEADARDDEDLRTRPIATLCGLFGTGLSNQQRKTLRGIAGRSYPLFDDMFCVEDDEEAVAAWGLLAKKLSVKQLFELNVLLDAEQKALYAKVAEMVGAHKEAASKSDDDEPDEE